MSRAELPILSLKAPAAEFAREMGESFRRFGFALVEDHGIDPALIGQGWDLCHALFALPENEKMRWHDPDGAGQRGYTPFGREIAKGASAHDLKEFWHVGRDLPAGHPMANRMPANVWPDEPAGFRDIFAGLYAAFDQVGQTILSRIALDLALPANWFTRAVADGNSILRLLHYPPLPDRTDDAVRAGAHEDINLVTLLLGAEEAGLELLMPDGGWLPVSPPEGALVVNIGDMLERMTNGVLPSTTHRVSNPATDRADVSRYSMPFFLHLHPDFEIATLPQCVTSERPDRWPESITADRFLRARLREIGLLPG